MYSPQGCAKEGLKMISRINQNSASWLPSLMRNHSNEFRHKGLGFVVVFIVVFGVWHVGSSFAQVPIVTQASFVSSSSFSVSGVSQRNWALDVANAQKNLNSDRLPDIGVARQQLDQVMMELENFLATSPHLITSALIIASASAGELASTSAPCAA